MPEPLPLVSTDQARAPLPEVVVPDGMPMPERLHAMLVVLVGLAAAVLQGSIVALALPDIGRALGASAGETVWVVNAYQIATLAVLLPLASFSDRVGYRRIYLGGMVVFLLASVGAMFASSLNGLIVARALQGLGASGIMAVNSALVRMIYPSASLGRGMALNSMVVASSAVAGPSVAAAVLSIADWPWLFGVNIPLGLLTIVLGVRSLPPDATHARPGQRFAPFDIVLNMLAFVLLFTGAQGLATRGGADSPGSVVEPRLAGLMLVAGAAAMVLYLLRQRRRTVPLFPVDLLRIPVFALSMVASVCAFSAQTLAYLGLPFLFLEVFGRSHFDAGMLITAWPLAVVVAAPLAGFLVGRVSDGLLGGIGMSLMACGLMLLATMPEQPSNLEVGWRMAVAGMGFGLFQTPNNHTIVTSPPRHRAGAASGMLGTARITGQTFGGVMLAAIFALIARDHGEAEIVALWLAAGLATAAGVASVLRVPAIQRR